MKIDFESSIAAKVAILEINIIDKSK